MIDENEFKRLLLRIIETYQLSPETAKEMLSQILAILNRKNE